MLTRPTKRHPYRMAGALCLPALQNATFIAWRVRFAYPPYKTPPLSHGGCALLTCPTKRHPHRMAGALCLFALQNATLIVGWVSAAHPPFLCHTIKTRPLKPSQKCIPATLTIIFIYFIGALHINVAPLHHNETTYYLKEEILKIKQEVF
ncbi:hypothetical protein KEM66_17245 [Cronobacter sakazakii]|uniref:hypothetical protein n=1 Tax=Cronobacter sakazakii TaxID=28141 RepID=UPI0011B206BB|nr:hypothetical protein [Cronobacter sakazakii]MBR9959000.1 hypothetical protein [Cronobacter sakazakii]